MSILVQLRRPWNWVLACCVLLGACGVLVAVRGRTEANPSIVADQARQAIRGRQWARVESLLNRLAKLRAPTATDTLLRAEFERARDRPDQALTVLSQITEGDPLAARARLLAGQIERARNRLRPAEAALREALRLDPKLVQAHRELVYLYGMQSRRAEVNAQFLALSELMTVNYYDQFVWTTSLQDLWMKAAFRTDLERFLAADPGDRWSRLALADVFLRSGNPDGADAALRPLPESDVDALVLRARLALDRSQTETARALLARGPAQHAGLARQRGRLAMRLKDLAGAAEQFRIAARLDPMSLEAFQGLSLALKSLGRADEAASAQAQERRLHALVSLLERAHSQAGRADRTLPRRIAAACEALGRKPEARGWYRIAADLDPLDNEIQGALYRLRDGPR